MLATGTRAGGSCTRFAAGALILCLLYGCGAKDANTDTLRESLSGSLAYGIGMTDYWYTGSPMWCTSGTTDWGTYRNEGDFESDNAHFVHNSGFPLSEQDRIATLNYIAVTLFKARYVRPIPGSNENCYNFDASATASAHATYRHGEGVQYSLWAKDPSQAQSPNWDIVVPIGTLSADSVTQISEYKMTSDIEYTCRSYQAVVSYHGIVPSLDGRTFQAQASYCLDPRDNKWHQQQFAWTPPQ